MHWRITLAALLLTGAAQPDCSRTLGTSPVGFCRLPTIMPLVLDPDWSAAEQEQIRRAAEQWRRPLGALPMAPRDCSRADPVPGCIVRLDRATPADIEVRSLEIRIYLGTIRANQASLPATVAHEIGHYMGLRHSDSDATLMYPVQYRLHVTAADLAALEKQCPSNSSE